MNPSIEPASRPGTPSTRPSLRQRIKQHLAAGWAHSRLIQIAAIVGVLIPIAYAGFYSYQGTERQSTQTVLARRESISILVATVLSEKLDRAIDLGVSLATRVRFQQLVQAGQWHEAIKILQGIPGQFPYVDRIFLTDPRGMVMTDTPARPEMRGTNLSTHDWYRGVTRTGKPYISEIYRRIAAPQANVVAIAVPMRNPAQVLTGILVLHIRLEAISEWFKDAPVDPRWMLYIVDQNGKAAFHRQHTVQGNTVDFSSIPAVQRVLQGHQGIEIEAADAQREERISAYVPIKRYGWGVILEEPTRTAFAATNAQLQRFAIIYGLMLVLAGVAAYLVISAREAARRKADLELLVAERTVDLENANKELQAFCYSVSHDLRAPLRSVDGFSRILLEDSADKLDAEGVSHLRRVRTAAQRMGELIDDLLDLSKVTRADLNRGNVDLSALARTVIEELQRNHPERQVTVKIEPGMKTVGDAPLLRVMLENLLGNAWKFTGKTPQARIEFGVQNDRAKGHVYFIRDNGAGFDTAYADKLFGAFQRLHSADEFPGTGIGLATVQRIARRHGGNVWAEAKIGAGATFYFTLTGATPH